MKLHKLPFVAETLDVSIRQVYNLIDRGAIRAVRIGSDLRVSEEELARIVREGTDSVRPVAVFPHTLRTGKGSRR